MNSKECLKHICDECQKNAGKIQVACPFRSISNEYCDEYETIKQDLDRLEKIEKERQEVETRLSGKETNTFDEIATMLKKANGYDVLADKCKRLEKENKELRKAVKSWNENGGKLIRENTKLKKALNVLKEKLEIQLHQDDEYFPIPMISGSEIYQNLTKEEYELLKEVLGNE